MSNIYTFSEFIFESKKNKKTKKDEPKKEKKAPSKKSNKKKADRDGDGDTDFADAKIAQYKAGGMDDKKALALSRKFNVNEMKKEYFSVDFKPEDMEKLKEGDKIFYRGAKFEVISANRYAIEALDVDGKKRTFNFNMFKDYGATR